MEDTFHLGIKALIRNPKGEILLLKVDPTKLRKTQEAYWDIPGGRIERGSNVEATLQREIEEEIGVSEISEVEEVAMVLSNIRIPQADDSDVGLILGIYSCSIPADAEIKISDEHTEYGWFSPVEAAELLKVKYPEKFTQQVLQLA